MNLLELVKKQGNPLIDGSQVTFIWQGAGAPCFISDLQGWEDNPRPLAAVAPGLWAITFDLPAQAYLEYAFYDPESKKRFPDPFNKKSIYNGVGSYNHFFYMPQAAPTPLTRAAAGAPRGILTRHVLPARYVTAGTKRVVHLYHPVAAGPLPLLVVYDGQDYLRRGKITQIVDNLIAQKRIYPLGLALVHSSPMSRTVEYGEALPTLGLLLELVLPLAAQNMPLLDIRKERGAFGVLGASLGGLMAVFTALKAPEVFGKALSQSGAFEMDGHATTTLQMARYFPVPPIKLWLDCGRMDFLYASNQAMFAVLKEKGYAVTYHENGGAHNYTTWRDNLADGLEALFG
jgi:enterochelin esterase-like enzyme